MIFEKPFRCVIAIVSYYTVSTYGSPTKCAITPLHEALWNVNTEYIQKEYLYAEDCEGLTPMHHAIRYGNIGFMMSLAEADFDVNRLNGEALPILHYSVKEGSLETTKMLLEIGSIPNAVNALMETPLYLSLQKHDEAVSRLLIASGASLALKDVHGNTLAHAFVERKELRALKLLEALNGELDVENNNQETPLLIAVKNDSPSLVNFLLAHGASISKLPYLHSALAAKAYNSLRALLENGIPTKTETEDGLSVIELAVKNELTEAVDILGSFPRDLPNYYFSKESTKGLNSNNMPYHIKDKDGNSVLHVSVKYDKLEIVKKLLSKHAGCNIDEEGEGGSTAMELAIRNDNTDIMEILASFGADISRSNQDKGSLMKQAIMSESSKAIVWLIDHGANPMERDKDGNTHLHTAAKRGKIQVIKSLLSRKEAVIIDEEGENNNTAMELAIKNDDTKVMDLLASFGANIHRQNSVNGSLLKLAVMEKSNKAIVWLIDHGADLEEKDVDGNTLLHLAIKLGNFETVKSLLTKNGSAFINKQGGKGYTAMEQAIMNDRKDIMEVLTSYGANVHQPSNFNGSLLKLAVMEKSNKAIAWLIDHGANPEEEDVEGNTLIHIAVRLGDVETIKTLLLSKNLSSIVDKEDKDGKTAMELAVIQDRTDTMEVLASYGADVDRTSKARGSLLKLAVNEKSSKAIAWLIDHGGHPEEEDVEGNTVLHIAVRLGDVETIKTLLLYKNISSIVDKEGKYGKTAMELAVIQDRADIMEVLASYGADVHRTSKARGSLLKLAVNEKSSKAIAWLIDHGGHPEEEDVEGNTVLHIAVRLGDVETIKTLLLYKNISSIVDKEGKYGKTAMELAVIQDRADIMEVLASYGADVHRTSKARGSLLKLAVNEKSSKAIAWLIGHGTDREEKDENGDMILHVAVRLGDIETIKALLSEDGASIVNMEGNEDNTPMDLAIFQDRTDIMEVLASYGAYIHRSLLKRAVISNSKNAVIWLIDHGANTDEKDLEGNTLLHIAAKSGKLESVKALLSRKDKFDVNSKGKDNFTPLFNAVESNQSSIVKELLLHGADIEAFRGNCHILPWAALNNHTETILELLSHPVNVNSNCVNGNTAMIFSADRNNLKVVMKLMELGADVNVIGQLKRSALIWATQDNYDKPDKYQIVKILLDNGAKVNLRDENGHTALYYAEKTGRKKTIDLIESKGGISI